MSRPYYIMHESRLRENLAIINGIQQRANVEFILAFKAFALWRTFDVFREYIQSTTASSLSEAMLAKTCFGKRAHTYSPAYVEDEFDTILSCSSHITFNSLSQYERYREKVRSYTDCKISCGLRVNPEYSEIETMLYNPCAPGSRFGVTADQLGDTMPEGIEGIHCHCHCESDSHALEHTLEHLKARFNSQLRQARWLNLGGGHLVTRKDYDVDHLVGVLKSLHNEYPNLRIILEPGSAFAWQTGELVTEVVDIVCNHGIKTAIINASFTCHMPDCLEMPYFPHIIGAEHVDLDVTGKNIYRIGGNSCLSGDFMGSWSFDHELQIGDRIVFDDMIHYTTVKTNMFNGITHPSLYFEHLDGKIEVLREFSFEDYRDRMC